MNKVTWVDVSIKCFKIKNYGRYGQCGRHYIYWITIKKKKKLI